MVIIMVELIYVETTSENLILQTPNLKTYFTKQYVTLSCKLGIDESID